MDRHPMPGEHATKALIIVLGVLGVPLLLLLDWLKEQPQPDAQQAVALIAQAQEVRP